jgi:predicted nucleotidyltransferase
MDQIKNSIIELSNQYIDVLNKHNFSIQKAILFGSYVKGNYKEYSDIDLALISKMFTGTRIVDRHSIVFYRRPIDHRIEPMPFTPEDFTEDNPLVHEIQKFGEMIYDKNAL